MSSKPKPPSSGSSVTESMYSGVPWLRQYSAIRSTSSSLTKGPWTRRIGSVLGL